MIYLRLLCFASLFFPFGSNYLYGPSSSGRCDAVLFRMGKECININSVLGS